MASYYDDWRACESVARAGYRFGWALNVRAFHLGWDDYKLHPGHLASKRRYGGEYREVHLIERAPSLARARARRPADRPDAAARRRRCRRARARMDGRPRRRGERAGGRRRCTGRRTDALPFVDGAAGAVLLRRPAARARGRAARRGLPRRGAAP